MSPLRQRVLKTVGFMNASRIVTSGASNMAMLDWADRGGGRVRSHFAIGEIHMY